jgi:hypothetical protein
VGDDGPRELGAPNALVGAYLNWLGLTQSAIVCITESPPEDMNWLTVEAARGCGIEVADWQESLQIAQDVAEPNPHPETRQVPTYLVLPDGTIVESEAAATPSAESGDPPAPASTAFPQRAIYYLQGREDSLAHAIEGSVTWTETTRENAAAAQAILRLSGREVTTTVTIYRNIDASLPWSHMVEVEFYGALGTVAIERVPALVPKQTEQARGDALVGTDARVTKGLFWIALSDDANDVARNMTLLREGEWFDIPILFVDQTRALLTFEKGLSGNRVFETVMAAWTQS